MKAKLILLCGLPGSGKTTLARSLVKEMAAVRLCPDEWMANLGIDLFDEEARDRLEQQFKELTWKLLELGQDVILEFGSWVRADRDKLREIAHTRGVRIELYFLDVPLKELERRLTIRNALAEHGTVPIERQKLEEYAQIFQAPTDEELALFDEPTVRLG